MKIGSVEDLKRLKEVLGDAPGDSGQGASEFAGGDPAQQCGDLHDDTDGLQWACTLPKGHAGRHAAVGCRPDPWSTV